MPFDHHGVRSWFQAFRDQDVGFYFMAFDFLVESSVDVEAIESVGCGGA